MKIRKIVAAVHSVLLFGVLMAVTIIVSIEERKQIPPPPGFCKGEAKWVISSSRKLANPRCPPGTGTYVLDLGEDAIGYLATFKKAEHLRDGRFATYWYEPHSETPIEAPSAKASIARFGFWDPRYEWARVVLAVLGSVFVTALVFGMYHLVLWFWSHW